MSLQGMYHGATFRAVELELLSRLLAVCDRF